jgi:hypothetical protein
MDALPDGGGVDPTGAIPLAIKAGADVDEEDRAAHLRRAWRRGGAPSPR